MTGQGSIILLPPKTPPPHASVSSALWSSHLQAPLPQPPQQQHDPARRTTRSMARPQPLPVAPNPVPTPGSSKRKRAKADEDEDEDDDSEVDQLESSEDEAKIAKGKGKGRRVKHSGEGQESGQPVTRRQASAHKRKEMLHTLSHVILDQLNLSLPSNPSTKVDINQPFTPVSSFCHSLV